MVYFEVGLKTQAILETLALPYIYLVLVPATAIFHTIRYITGAKDIPKWWKFTHYINLNIERAKKDWGNLRLLPRIDPEHWTMVEGSEKRLKECDVVQVVVKPLDENVPRIEVLEVAQDVVKPVQVPGFMMKVKKEDGSSWSKDELLAKANSGERIIYFIVGGGFVGGHPIRNHITWSMAKITGARVFCVNYRKSLRKHMAFPASLLDTLAGYQYLVDDLGFKPENIMLNGDSAGANACMALARYLDDVETQTSWKKWGEIGSMCLHCPWSDLTSSFPSLNMNRYTDSIADFTKVNIPSHTRHFPDRSNPYLSPALQNPKDRHFNNLAEKGVKIYISAGTSEGFYDEIKALRDRMMAAGIDVTYREFPGASHSDFVSWDRGVATRGWTWGLTKQDFEDFWKAQPKNFVRGMCRLVEVSDWRRGPAYGMAYANRDTV